MEERKNDQIEHIKKSHEKAFNEIKNYYNDITLNNLAMIATLKEEIKERDVKIERSEKQVRNTLDKDACVACKHVHRSLIKQPSELGGWLVW